MVDIDQWLLDHDVSPAWARKMAEKLKQRYPAMTDALKASKDVTAELQVMQLIHDVKSGLFPEVLEGLAYHGAVYCSICHKLTDALTAHLHQEEWIGEECWDERLRASE